MALSPILKAIKNCGSSDVVLSNQGLKDLRTELGKNPEASGLITKMLQLFREEPALSFAASKAINEICAIFVEEKGMHLNGGFPAYKKITALLMVYDYCKAHAEELLEQEFGNIIHRSLESKTATDARVSASQEKIAGFISQLVLHSTFSEATQQYTISLDGYSIHNESGALYLKPGEQVKASFVVNIDEGSITPVLETHHATGIDQVEHLLGKAALDEDEEATQAQPNLDVPQDLSVEELTHKKTLVGDVHDADVAL